MIYTVNKKRPINLDLSTFKYPPMAIASILHRISGLVLFLLLPLMLYFLHRSLGGAEAFANLQLTLASPYSKVLLWAFASALIYHLLAGIRHLLMDMDIGEHLEQARRSAVLVIALSVILIILLGVWIW
jgi:succinate dehydrogenase / fumarate reductase, cytochrome b subunit